MRRIIFALAAYLATSAAFAAEPEHLRVAWKDNYLTVSGEWVPGKEIRVLYLEAFCRAGSTKREWKQTVIKHQTRLVSADAEGRVIRLQSTLADGVVVEHEITAGADEVDFKLVANNASEKASEVDWGQPCVRVERFTGKDKETYLGKCFIFQGGKLHRMPTEGWATEALYTPGQVWAMRGIDRGDVNPRPLNPNVPDHSLIGCYSGDEKMMLAVAFEPCQELFQGVFACLHSDFRIGGLAAGEKKTVNGKIYVVPADEGKLVARWRKDFGKEGAAK